MGLGRQPGGIKRNLRQLKHGRPMLTVTRPSAVRRGSMTPFLGLHADHVLGRSGPVVHKAGKAARAVAALLDLGAVGVVDHVFEVNAGAGRGPHGQDLVGAHAEVAVAQKAVVGRGQAQAATGLVEHDKVVASPLHFGERNAHGVDYPPMVARL